MEVAGRIFQTSLPPQPNKKVEFVWDGLDYLGRQVTGSTLAIISIGFVYRGAYYSAEAAVDLRLLPRPVQPSTGSCCPGRSHYLEAQSRLSFSAESTPWPKGWTLSSHHFMSPSDPTTLYKGDGTTVKNNTQSYYHHCREWSGRLQWGRRACCPGEP